MFRLGPCCRPWLCSTLLSPLWGTFTITTVFFEDFFFHLANVAGVAGFWWRDVVREATFGGHHTRAVQKGLKMGFTLFLVSEAMLFFSLFWTFFLLSGPPVGGVFGNSLD